MRGTPLRDQIFEERAEPDLSGAFAARGADAVRDAIEPLVDRLDLLHHHSQLRALRRVGRRLGELLDEYRERGQRRVELVSGAGRERAELDHLLVAQRRLAHRRELLIAPTHDTGHAPDEEHDQGRSNHEVHPHAGYVQAKVAAEALVDGR